MSKLTLYESVINRDGFYRKDYRSSVVILFVTSLCSLPLSLYIFHIALKPHKVSSIITTIDGRLVFPSRTYFKQTGQNYFSRLLNA
ncbi:MAG: hypothetical protein VXY77_01715 [Pseudomonadota bacterium]|nr:hypothetical protein [Pseudomonadota bacterium]